jgi:hypothetical protein
VVRETKEPIGPLYTYVVIDLSSTAFHPSAVVNRDFSSGDNFLRRVLVIFTYYIRGYKMLGILNSGGIHNNPVFATFGFPALRTLSDTIPFMGAVILSYLRIYFNVHHSNSLLIVYNILYHN